MPTPWLHWAGATGRRRDSGQACLLGQPTAEADSSRACPEEGVCGPGPWRRAGSCRRLPPCALGSAACHRGCPGAGVVGCLGALAGAWTGLQPCAPRALKEPRPVAVQARQCKQAGTLSGHLSGAGHLTAAPARCKAVRLSASWWSAWGQPRQPADCLMRAAELAASSLEKLLGCWCVFIYVCSSPGSSSHSAGGMLHVNVTLRRAGSAGADTLMPAGRDLCRPSSSSSFWLLYSRPSLVLPSVLCAC